MAILYLGRQRVTSAAGDPISGGKLRIYDANTTTLSTVYSDSGLTTPLTNPVVADSEGWLPTIHAAEGTAVDVAHMTAAGVVLWTQDDWAFVGQSNTSFSRDFTGSRAQIRNSGGTVQWESGNATGDDSGGSARFGGWNGTQADDISIDGAAVNVTGTLTEGSKSLQGVIYTAATAFTTVSEVLIALPNSPTGTVSWKIAVWNLVSSLDCQLRAQLSYDNGATYKSGVADYATNNVAHYNSTSATLTSTGQAYMPLSTTTLFNNATNHGRLTVEIVTVPSGTAATVVDTRLSGGEDTGSTLGLWLGSHSANGGYGKATHLRLYPSTGTITGKYLVIPQRGYT